MVVDIEKLFEAVAVEFQEMTVAVDESNIAPAMKQKLIQILAQKHVATRDKIAEVVRLGWQADNALQVSL